MRVTSTGSSSAGVLSKPRSKLGGEKAMGCLSLTSLLFLVRSFAESNGDKCTYMSLSAPGSLVWKVIGGGLAWMSEDFFSSASFCVKASDGSYDTPTSIGIFFVRKI